LSLRAELLRLCLRWLVKRNIGAATTVEEVRARLLAAGRWIPDPPAGVDMAAVDAGGVPGAWIRAPTSINERCILYLHGGGYVAGSPPLYRDLTWRVAARARARVLCIDYRLAPEHPFPAALEDAVAAYLWMLEQGARPTRMAIMGDSAGGGLAFATLLRLRDAGKPLPAAVVALSPCTDLALTGASLKRHAGSEAIMPLAEAPRLARYYLAGADPRTPYASPLYGDLSGLPPTLIQVGSDEILLDDALRMADKLWAAGCGVQIETWPRMPHGWQLFARALPEARQALRYVGAFLRERL
jgi:monoterpene epsilon-lactone hydrolase